MTIQTFGDYAKWHLHIHSIVADGLFRRNGIFHVMPRISIKSLSALFLANVLTMLKRKELIDDEFIAMIIKWRHTSGFSVDNSVCISRDDEVGIINLAQYIIRSSLNYWVCYDSLMSLLIYEDFGLRSRCKKITKPCI